MNFSATRPVEPAALAKARDAFSFENRQISPARQASDVSEYDQMIRELERKPSTRETLLALASA